MKPHKILYSNFLIRNHFYRVRLGLDNSKVKFLHSGGRSRSCGISSSTTSSSSRSINEQNFGENKIIFSKLGGAISRSRVSVCVEVMTR